jgi:hypothetical protein
MNQQCLLTGTIKCFLLFDIAEEIDLGSLRRILGTSPRRREPAFRHPAPEYVKFERPPVEEHIGAKQVASGDLVTVRVRYFDYGVASVEMERPFTASWEELVGLANRWIMSPELETSANSILRECLKRSEPALLKAYKEWISEDYYVVQLEPVSGDDGELLTAECLLRDRGDLIAQIVRGEDMPLSKTERQEVLQSSMSYHPTDLLVIGWVAAFLYDSQAGAEPTVHLLEYANTQLLEFRYYDDVLTDVLADVYKRLERKHSMWARWQLAREAENLNTIRLDYQELAERTDNAIKFLSDMFYARTYRLAAARIGVTDYRDLVTEKLTTARDLYTLMVDEFHQGRAFFLELMVVIILLIEIVFLFRGKG